MTCMKCGREVESEQVFCEDCFLEMKKYPVNPNAVVQLPLRKRPVPARKTVKRRTISQEDQIRILKKRLWILTGVLAVTLLLLLSMIYPTVNFFIRNYYLRPGQNYSTVTATTESSAPRDGSFFAQ